MHDTNVLQAMTTCMPQVMFMYMEHATGILHKVPRLHGTHSTPLQDQSIAPLLSVVLSLYIYLHEDTAACNVITYTKVQPLAKGYALSMKTRALLPPPMRAIELGG